MFPSKADLKCVGDDPRHRARQPVRAAPGHRAAHRLRVSLRPHEKKISNGHPERFGRGAIEGVAAPRPLAFLGGRATSFDHSLGMPGDTVNGALLGALIIHGIVPGPQIISQHADILWGKLIASFLDRQHLWSFLNVPIDRNLG